MIPPTAIDVARRCLCLELLHQRLLLEEADDAIDDRERARVAWLGRHDALGVTASLSDQERVLLAAPVGTLDDEALDDLHGRATGAVVLLWALGRLDARPTWKTIEAMEQVLADHGLLGDGSVSQAKAAAEAARLRDEGERDEAWNAYSKSRGKAREVDDPERIFAEVAAHHLAWIDGDEELED